tara:strand:- start:264 stop:548 length:285 start_codon:yes stop_codon:yes gene_type:complete
MSIPLIKPDTMQSIIEEVYIKNDDFGIEEFRSKLETDNKNVAIVLYAFIDAISSYMAEDDPERVNEYSSIAKISCNLLYKTIEKQIEIDEMSYE